MLLFHRAHWHCLAKFKLPKLVINYMTYLFLSICLTKRNTVVIMIHLYFVSQAMWEQFNWFMPIQLLIILAASVPREDLLKKLLPIHSFWKCKLRSTSEPCLVLLVSIPWMHHSWRFGSYRACSCVGRRSVTICFNLFLDLKKIYISFNI